jgi:tRNA-binding protein
MAPAKVKPAIPPELLDQIDVRVGTIESVNDVANSDKLVSLWVNFCDHLRTVLAGMKRERAKPREIEGKQALFVVNLPPRKMAGMVSEAMLFDIGYAEGIPPVLAVPEAHNTQRDQGRIMLTDSPPRKKNLVAFQESDKRKTVDVPQDGHLLVPAKSIDVAMRDRRSAAVGGTCAEFLDVATGFYKVPCRIRVLVARPLRVHENWTTELLETTIHQLS